MAFPSSGTAQEHAGHLLWMPETGQPELCRSVRQNRSGRNFRHTSAPNSLESLEVMFAFVSTAGEFPASSPRGLMAPMFHVGALSFFRDVKLT